jgi:hypothetical protein
MAEVVAALTRGGLFQPACPKLSRPFRRVDQEAVIMAAAHPIMGILYAAAAEAAKNGFQAREACDGV